MNDIVEIKRWDTNDSSVIFSRMLAEKLGISKRKRGYVSFGTERNYVDIDISEKVPGNNVLLSTNVISNLHLPDYIVYELRIKGNEIVIGPCIGILAASKSEDITKRRLKEISMNTLDYQTVHGAILAFSLDMVDTSKRLIEGYCYNPQLDSWEKGVFPYPLSIYNRSGLNEEWLNHFLSCIGDTVFNNFHFDKWMMYKWFSEEPKIMPFLPETRILQSAEDIFDMLKKYDKVYIKPIWGMKGFGVVQVKRDGNSAVFNYRQDGQNKEITAANIDEIDKTIKHLFKPNSHIIQQGLELAKYNDGVIDFRCVMQKNGSCDWVCNGIFARVGARKSVVSNISSGGMAYPAVELIMKVFSISEAEAFAIKEKLVNASMKVCSTLDDYGINFCTLGMDLGMDREKRIWLIEVNNRSPHPAIAMRVNDLQAYYAILSSPLYYAKALAGFE